MEGASDPYVSPDGVWRWNGAGWVPNVVPRAFLPGRLQAARILLYVQGGLTIVIGGLIALVIGSIGLLSASDSGQAAAMRPLLGSGLVLAVALAVGGAQIVSGLRLMQRRWAYPLAVALQVLILPVSLGLSMATLLLLLLPESRAAIRTAGR